MKIDDRFIADLSLLGLTDYELRTFAAATALGSATAALLAKRAKIPRSSVYPVLKSLSEKGLITIERREGVSNYIPSNPERLILIAEERLLDAQKGMETSKQLVKVLQSAQTRDAITSAKVLIFEGRKSIEGMLEDNNSQWRQSLMKSKRPWMGFQDAAFLKHYGYWVVDYWKEFGRKPGHEKDIVKLFSEEDPETKRIVQPAVTIAGDRRMIKPLPNRFPFSATLWITGEYVVLLKTRVEPHYAIQIRDQILAENLAAMFDFTWSLAT